MSGLEQLAKKLLEQAHNGEDPFAKLARDLPGPAQPAGSGIPGLAPGAEAGAGMGLSKIAPGVAAGMLIPSATQSNASDVGDKRGLEAAEAAKIDPASLPMKGNPEMIDMDPKDQSLVKNFESYGKKQLGDGFSVSHLGVEDRTGDKPEKYSLEMRTEGPMSDQDKMKVAGINSMLRRDPRMKKGMKNEVDLGNSKSNKVNLEEDH